ncbi:2Fe-2S iron-sulfur cluster-binding protein [Bacillus sp. EB01]|uniref:2Fe-2S iron-sulfur cluster-binding protein n=1 Tax=Bacillus sp. EB01 TaxID=1347086 RepID=UPI0012DD756A|nr:2Fe-2S iron-sulfur cluster-binding protein [Bacillus sp. EB01]
MSTITLKIYRGDPLTEGRYVEYEVPFEEGSSLLDAIFYIRESEDPSLSVRYSCKSANACKECMAIVDGKAGYLCSMRAREDAEVTIEPLKGRPLIKDLVVNMD